MSKPFTILAPVSGAIIALDQVPDVVFSKKMLGDGIAIDPAQGIVYAPFDGKIVNLNKNLHALVLANEKLEVLIHVGLDTVYLRGRGFTALVKTGDTVQAGQPILKFDLAQLHSHVSCPFVMCVVSAPKHVHVSVCARGDIIEANTALLNVSIQDQLTQDNEAEFFESDPIVIINPQGLHARPAGTLVQLVAAYPYAVLLCKADQHVNAKSITSIMSLALSQGDSITVRVAGPAQQAKELVQKIKQGFENAFGEKGTKLPHTQERLCN